MDPTAFDEFYQHVPEGPREQLRAFRASHPYQYLVVGGVQWKYIASGPGPHFSLSAEGERALLLLGGGLPVGETSCQTILRLESRFRF